MELVVARRARVRATLLWLTVTAALAGLAALTAPLARDLLLAPGPAFADALVQLCALGAGVAGLLLWLAATDVAWGVLRPGGVPRQRRVGPVRLALLAACGVTVLATTTPAHAGSAAPASSDAPVGSGAPLSAEALAGLPLPDRPVAPLDASPTVTTATVAPGDSVWTVAARRLGPGTSQAAVASYWLRVLALNADTLGPDPDLVRPGQSLRLPPV